MEINLDIRFFKNYYQIDEHHAEDTFFCIGEPKREFKQIIKEAREDFLFRASEGEEVDLSNIIDRMLEDNSFYKVVSEERASFDVCELNSEWVQKKLNKILNPNPNQVRRDYDFLEKVNKIRKKRNAKTLQEIEKEEEVQKEEPNNFLNNVEEKEIKKEENKQKKNLTFDEQLEMFFEKMNKK